VQKSFHPFILMDLEFEALNTESKCPNSDDGERKFQWPSFIPTFASGESISRKIEVFNGALASGSMVLKWETRWDNPTGALIATNATDPFPLEAGSHVTKSINFLLPDPQVPTKKLYFILYSIKDGVVVFTEDRLYVNVASHGIAPSAQFVGFDTKTEGNWGGVYGKDGYLLCNYLQNAKDVLKLPPYLSSISFSTPSNWVWNATTTETRVLAPNLSNTGVRTAACYYNDEFDVVIISTDAEEHAVALYALDYDQNSRTQSFSALSAANLEPLCPTQTADSFVNGVYARFTFKGSIIIRLAKQKGSNANVSGLFFG